MLTRRERPRQIIERVIYIGWWTMDELLELAYCSEPRAYAVVKQIAENEVVFRRQRKAAFRKPYEYRCFPRAVSVRAVQEQA